MGAPRGPSRGDRTPPPGPTSARGTAASPRGGSGCRGGKDPGGPSPEPAGKRGGGGPPSPGTRRKKVETPSTITVPVSIAAKVGTDNILGRVPLPSKVVLADGETATVPPEAPPRIPKRDPEWRRPPRRRVLAIRDRLRELYGRPVNQPHGHPIAELVRGVLSQNTN